LIHQNLSGLRNNLKSALYEETLIQQNLNGLRNSPKSALYDETLLRNSPKSALYEETSILFFCSKGIATLSTLILYRVGDRIINEYETVGG
jgi:hypothetical protein